MDGAASIDFGSVNVGSSSAAKTFTIRNTGTANLTGLAITKDGSHPGDFTVGALGATTLAPNASTTFTVTFSPSAVGARGAALHIASNDSDENPFDIALAGTGIIIDYTVTTTGGMLVVTDISGNSDTLTVSEPSAGNIQFAAAGRTFSVDGGAFITGDSGTLPLGGVTQITVNAGAGADTINVGAFTGTLPSLTLNGGTGDDTVNFNGDLTFAAGASLDVDLQNDDATPGVDQVNLAANANLKVSGAGTITVKCSKNVLLNSGSSLETVDGNLTVEANQQVTPTAGNFQGVFVLSGATVAATGTGQVTVKGKGGDAAISNAGVVVESGGTIRGGTSGALSVQGFGGASSGAANHGVVVSGGTITSLGADVSVTGLGGGSGASSSSAGVVVQSAGTVTSGGSGTVTVQGTGGGGSGGSNQGVFVGSAGAKITSSGGSVQVTGIEGTGADSVAIFAQNSAAITTAVNGGTLTLIGNSMLFFAPLTISAQAGSSVTLRPYTPSVGIDLGAATDPIGGPLNLTDAELDFITAGTLIIGDANSGNITISAPITINPASVTALRLVTPGTIADTYTGGTDVTVASLTTSNNLAPGTSPGLFSVAGNHTFADNSTFTVEIGGTAAGTGYDQLSASGSVTIGANVTLSVASFGGFMPATNQSFMIISRTGGSGTFAGLAEGATFPDFLSSGLTATLTYVGGTGDDVVLLMPAPEIAVSGNSVNIPDGASTPSLADHTDFGSAPVAGGTVVRTFTITNTGNYDLTLGTVTLGGTHPGNFSVTAAPASPVTPGNTTTFQITFDPSASGLRSATVSFSNNDGDENPFNFSLQGTGARLPLVGYDWLATDGPLAGQTGGTGWDYDRINNVHTGNVADWDNVSGVVSVVGGAIVTVNNSAAKREFNGTIEGNTGGDGPNTERAGAVRGTGVVFVRFDLTRAAGDDYSGLSVYEFGAERFFFGVRGAGAFTDTVGIEVSGGAGVNGAIQLTDNVPATLVAVVDYDNDKLGLFVNPDCSDTWDATGGTADVKLAYTGANWATAVRVASGRVRATWDNIKVANTFEAAIVDYTVTTTGGAIVVTDVAGKNDTLTVSEPGAGSIRFAAPARNFKIDGVTCVTGDSGNLSLAGITSITVNAGAGANTLNVGAFTGTLTNLTLNGGTGDDTVNFNGDLTFAAGASLDVDLQNDDAAPGVDTVNLAANANVKVFGTGTITVKCSKNVLLNSGSSLETVDGNLTVEANQQATPTAGNFKGLHVNNGLIQVTGTGLLAVRGKGGDTGTEQHGINVSGSLARIQSTSSHVTVLGTGGASTSDGADGVRLELGGKITTGASGTATITGVGGAGAGSSATFHMGVRVFASEISTVDGVLSITGTGGPTPGTTVGQYGIVLAAAALVQSSNNGPITLDGRGGGSTGSSYNVGIQIVNTGTLVTTKNGLLTILGTYGAGSGGAAFEFGDLAGVTSTGMGNLVLQADTIDIGADATVNIGANSATLRQKTNGRPINLGAADSATELGFTDAELDRVTAGTLIIGDANSGNITISAAISPANAPALRLVTPGTIADTYTGATDVTVASLTTSNNLAPGTSPGLFSVAGNHTFAANSTFTVEIGGTTAGTQYDQLSASGSVTIGANVTLSVASSGGFVPAINQSFMLISRTGGGGTFAGLPEGATFPNFLGSGLTATLTYTGGTGDDVVLVMPAPEIAVSGNSVNIPDGASTPSLADHTDFGNALVAGGTVVRTFTITNSGNYDLTLGTVTLGGTHSGNFSVTAAPASPVTPGNTTTFQITFDPSASGLRSATVSFSNNDGDEDPFNFSLRGTGVDYTVTTTGNAIVVTDVSGNSDTLTVTEPSPGNIRFAAGGRYFSVDGGAGLNGNSGALSRSGVTQITVNAGAGADTITVNAFTGTLTNLTLNGGTGNDTVNFNGDLTFAAGASLDVDLQNDDATPGVDSVTLAVNANLKVFGTGTIKVKCSRNVLLNSGSSLETVDGNLTVEANTSGAATGNFTGIILDNAQIISSGSGNILLDGKGGDDAASNVHEGVRLSGSACRLESSGTGSITILGEGGTGTDNNTGVLLAYISNPGPVITSVKGAITITGTGGAGTTVSSDGVELYTAVISSTGTGASAATITVTGTGGTGTSINCGVDLLGTTQVKSVDGAIEVVGTGGGGANSVAVSLGIEIAGGAILSSGAAPITIRGDSMFISSASAVTNAGANTVTLRQKTGGVAINLGSTATLTAGTLELSDAELDLITAGTLRIGDANSGDITISAPITHPVNNNFVLTSGGNIVFNTGSLNTGGGTLTLTPGAAGSVQPTSSGVEVTTSASTALAFAAGADLAIAINGTTVNTQYRQLNVAGQVNLTGVDLVLSGSYVPLPGNTFTIVNNDGADAITGTFNGLPEGTILTFNGVLLGLSYAGGDGNDVVLTYARPVVTCPVSLTTNTASGTDLVPVVFPAPVVTGFPVPAVACVPPAGSSFAVGVTPVLCTATNLVGTNTCTFTVTVCATNIIVTTILDNGPGSLRQALADVCPTGTITFAPSLNGQAITLTSGELAINKALNIIGPGPGSLAVLRSLAGGTPAFRIFTNSSSASISGLTISNGLVLANGLGEIYGGGLANFGTLTLSNCVISGNAVMTSILPSATYEALGGGLYNGSGWTAHVVDCTFRDNSVIAQGVSMTVDYEAKGGGVFNDGGTLRLLGSSFNNNLALSTNGNTGLAVGGGVGQDGGATTMTNCTVSGNTAIATNAPGGNTAEGGGIGVGSGALVLSQVTVASNRVSALNVAAGGGVYQSPISTVSVQGSLIAGNRGTTGPDVNGVFASQGHNLVGATNSATGWVASDLTGSTSSPLNPLLGPLANNGGPTLTHALLPGSPALDAGDNSGAAGLATDQRGAGFPRVFNTTVDIGAFEVQINVAPSFTKGLDQTVLEDAGPQTVVNWATAISPGPPAEAGQTVAFQVTGNSNPALFSAGPVIAPDGTLTYTPALHANGTANITLLLRDNGGTAQGGVDTSGAQTFAITVTPSLVASNATYVRAPGLSLRIRIADIAREFNGRVVRVLSVSAGSQRATLNVNSTDIFYIPANNNNDSFTYTVGNGIATATGTITITVAASGGLPATITVSGGMVTLKFFGIPGLAYDVQRTTSLTEPVTWTTLTPVSPISSGADGSFTYIDTSPPSGAAFYRSLQH